MKEKLVAAGATVEIK
ncbi:hypothetical protein [uncultured Holdemanella sp.]|nr:hypothetical protein [uncultured Holdemanella sp.]